MNEKLNKLYNECLQELYSIGIKIIDNKEIGKIEIKISKRSNKRYGSCKQMEPLLESRYIEIKNKRKYIKYHIYKKHYIEISLWVMELNDNIIKNTIMHELIHCFPYCNNHGKEFKKYAKYINEKLGYNITRVGNKEEDYKKSNIKYKEQEVYKYKIQCKKCGQIAYRKRIKKDFIKKYRCAICGGNFTIMTNLY